MSMSEKIKTQTLFVIVDKLEQRIATLEKVSVKLEKVSGSHAKCIGEIREEKPCPTKKQKNV